MRLLLNSFDDPYENLAFEEQYFKSFDQDTIRLWINPESVVCGKHQIALKECNIYYCDQRSIPVIRRLSGGGTVFHDPGNINFSFFKKLNSGSEIDYTQNLKIITSVLNQLGFEVRISPRHDLFLDEFKVSGNAQHVSNDKALHHGTLLYDAKIKEMSPATKRTSGTFTDKSVPSVRSKVMNLRDAKDVGDSSEFLRMLAGALLKSMEVDNSRYHVDKALLDKYKRDEWNFGYGPKYVFKNEISDSEFSLTVDRGGVITGVNSNSESLRNDLSRLIGINHTTSDVRNELKKYEIQTADLEEYLF